MRLLIITQAVDERDPVLGFFVRWLQEFAKHSEQVEVICLREGKHTLPRNVAVHSLGRERGVSRLIALRNFYRSVWKLRHRYDAVFVHMNQEYVLIAGWLWLLLGKRMYLWRNHYAGSWLTNIAAAFCTKVFCTSKHSYTAKYKKAVLMPVGVDTERFFPDERVARIPRSILFLSRMSPSKRPEMLIDALASLAHDDVSFTATLVGSPLPRDKAYYESLKEKVRELKLVDRINFLPGVPNDQTPDLYRAHDIFVNTSPSGMLDKTLFEAAASGCRVLAASADFAELTGPESHFDSATELAGALGKLLAGCSDAPVPAFVAQNSLTFLIDRLEAEFSNL
jgi:glycosyltransferase involved in cell wall biosynthesis